MNILMYIVIGRMFSYERYLIYVIIGRISGASFVSGWASIIAFVCFFGSFQILCIGIIGEYISKIYIETKHRPKYNIDEIIW